MLTPLARMRCAFPTCGQCAAKLRYYVHNSEQMRRPAPRGTARACRSRPRKLRGARHPSARFEKIGTAFMDAYQIYHFLFETPAGVGILVLGGIIVCIILSALMEVKTRKTFVDRGEKKDDEDDWFFDDDDEDENDDDSSTSDK